MNKKLEAKYKEMNEFFGSPETPVQVAWGCVFDASNIILSDRKELKKEYSYVWNATNIDNVKLTDFVEFLMAHNLKIKIEKEKK
jgi:hypothetical protein